MKTCRSHLQRFSAIMNTLLKTTITQAPIIWHFITHQVPIMIQLLTKMGIYFNTLGRHLHGNSLKVWPGMFPQIAKEEASLPSINKMIQVTMAMDQCICIMLMMNSGPKSKALQPAGSIVRPIGRSHQPMSHLSWFGLCWKTVIFNISTWKIIKLLKVAPMQLMYL